MYKESDQKLREVVSKIDKVGVFEMWFWRVFLPYICQFVIDRNTGVSRRTAAKVTRYFGVEVGVYHR